METTTQQIKATLDTLFKRTKTGAIQFWKIEVSHEIDKSTLIKTSGKLGTENPLVNKEFITEGKNLGKSNATTSWAQAELQAESDWKKKRDEGYKSLEDLDITLNPDAKAIHNCSIIGHLQYFTLEEALNQELPQFNTDANGNVKPMLAQDWKGGKKVKYPCYIQPKLDGVRCLMIVNEPEAKFLSRSGKEYTTLIHIADDIFEAFAEGRIGGSNSPSSFILDGEIYSDELTFQEITSAVKSLKETSRQLYFRAYDIVSDDTQDVRWEKTVELLGKIQSPYIYPVITLMIENAEDVKLHHDQWVKDGYEGAMIRMLDGHYGQGQRSSHLLKVKEFDEAEYEFLQWETGQREEDLIAVLKTKIGQEFRAKMIGTREAKKEMRTKQPKLITLKYFGLTAEFIPRFPVGKGFRDYE